jgi:hypothetical protein
MYYIYFIDIFDLGMIFSVSDGALIIRYFYRVGTGRVDFVFIGKYLK